MTNRRVGSADGVPFSIQRGTSSERDVDADPAPSAHERDRRSRAVVLDAGLCAREPAWGGATLPCGA